MIKEERNIYDLMKALEELDIKYTKAISLEYSKGIEDMSIACKDSIDEDLQNQLEEYKKNYKGKDFHYSEYEVIKDKIYNIYVELKCVLLLKKAKREIGDIVYERSRQSYGVILNRNKESKLYNYNCLL